MRVLMVSSLWPPEVLGGAEQYAAALAERLQLAGHVVGVVTLGVEADGVVATVPSWPYPIQDYAAQSGVRRAGFHAADLARPDTGRILDRAFAKFAPDVVHSHVVQGMGATALTRTRRRGIGHVHTLHDYWLLCQRNSLVQRDGSVCTTRCSSCRVMSDIRNRQVSARPPEVVIGVSEAIARLHLAELPWMRGRTRVVYNPVERPRPRVPRREDRAVTFGYIGRLGIDKGVHTMLRAFERARVGDARLVVAGEGPEAAAVQAADGVDARGWVSGADKDAWFDEVDCLIVPSQWSDPAPLVVNEARSRGLAVIGSTAGGIPELIAPECVALLVPPADVDALAAAMERFVAAPSEFTPVAEAQPLDWNGHVEAIEVAYRAASVSASATERGDRTPLAGVPFPDARGSSSSADRG